MGRSEMRDIVIVCAGNYGKEVYYTVRRINDAAVARCGTPEYNVLGFLSDVPDALDGSGISAPIIGTVKGWQPVADEVYALGLGTPDDKKRVTDELRSRGCRFETIVAPYTTIPYDARIGQGCFVKAYHIASGVTIGDFCNLQHGALLTPGAVVGDYSTVTGFAVIEHATVGERVYVGSHCVVTEGVTVGDGATLSAGSIVTENVRPGTRAFGYPATEMRMA